MTKNMTSHRKRGGLFQRNMASLRPESDKPLENHRETGHLLQDKLQKDERSSSTDGITDNPEDFCRDSGGIKERQGSGKELGSSVSQPSFVQPASKPNINSDLKLGTESTSVSSGDPKSNIESRSVNDGVSRPKEPGLIPRENPTGAIGFDFLPSDAVKACTGSDSGLPTPSGGLKSCSDADSRFEHSEDLKQNEEPAMVQSESIDSVHRDSIGDLKSSTESVSRHCKLIQFTESAPVQTATSEHQESAPGSTSEKLESTPVHCRGGASPVPRGSDSTLSTAFSGEPKPSNKPGHEQPSPSGDPKPVDATTTCKKDVTPSGQSDSVGPPGSSPKLTGGLKDDDHGLVWSEPEEEFDLMPRDNSK